MTGDSLIKLTGPCCFGKQHPRIWCFVGEVSRQGSESGLGRFGFIPWVRLHGGGDSPSPCAAPDGST